MRNHVNVNIDQVTRVVEKSLSPEAIAQQMGRIEEATLNKIVADFTMGSGDIKFRVGVIKYNPLEWTIIVSTRINGKSYSTSTSVFDDYHAPRFEEEFKKAAKAIVEKVFLEAIYKEFDLTSAKIVMEQMMKESKGKFNSSFLPNL